MESSNQSTVLLIEDEADLAELYAGWLRDAYQVRVATTGEAALELVDSSVDVALVDRRLPGMSGDAVVAEFERRSYAIQVAMVSAVEPAFDIMELGFDDYLEKPASRDSLHTLVETLLNRSAYDSDSQEYFQLLSKRAVLEAEYTDHELREHQDYQELEARLTELEAQLDMATQDFSNADYTALFHNFSAPD